MKYINGLVVGLAAVALFFSVKLVAGEHGGKAAEHGGSPAKVEKEQDRKSEEHGGEEASEEPKTQEVEEKSNDAEEEGDIEEEEEEEEESKSGDQSRQFHAEEIKTAMMTHINNRTQNYGGYLIIQDPKENHRLLKLKFVKIHDPVRVIAGKGYFACTDFEVDGERGKLYDLDFWLNPVNGQLEVTQDRIHKEPREQGGKWVKVARYTFVNDEPVAVQ